MHVIPLIQLIHLHASYTTDKYGSNCNANAIYKLKFFMYIICFNCNI